jgi:hypothetical protein
VDAAEVVVGADARLVRRIREVATVGPKVNVVRCVAGWLQPGTVQSQESRWRTFCELLFGFTGLPQTSMKCCATMARHFPSERGPPARARTVSMAAARRRATRMGSGAENRCRARI